MTEPGNGTKRKKGTKEWAEVNKNIQKGCEHNCRYCYARANAKRFKQIENSDDWKEPIILTEKALYDKPVKVEGRIMFPTTHDITPNNIDYVKVWLYRWLEVGNDILIVSKPHFYCIADICDTFEQFKDQITFRFTIGSTDDDVLKFWEEGAPPFKERLYALKYAYMCGYKTSVSCEPFLDDTIMNVIGEVTDYVSDTIWVGKMNKINNRVDQKGWTQKEIFYLDKLLDAQTDEKIKYLYWLYQKDPTIHWKDSIKEVLGLPEEVVG
jgi:DNA repair photolyase